MQLVREAPESFGANWRNPPSDAQVQELWETGGFRFLISALLEPPTPSAPICMVSLPSKATVSSPNFLQQDGFRRGLGGCSRGDF